MRLEGHKSHKTRLIVLILGDEGRAPVSFKGECPYRCHGAAAEVLSHNQQGPLSLCAFILQYEVLHPLPSNSYFAVFFGVFLQI